MALTDIVCSNIDPVCVYVNRGNIGTIADIDSAQFQSCQFTRTLPTVSDVRGGIQYGVDGTEYTGTAPTDEEIADAVWDYAGTEGRTLTS